MLAAAGVRSPGRGQGKVSAARGLQQRPCCLPRDSSAAKPWSRLRPTPHDLAE